MITSEITTLRQKIADRAVTSTVVIYVDEARFVEDHSRELELLYQDIFWVGEAGQTLVLDKLPYLHKAQLLRVLSAYSEKLYEDDHPGQCLMDAAQLYSWFTSLPIVIRLTAEVLAGMPVVSPEDALRLKIKQHGTIRSKSEQMALLTHQGFEELLAEEKYWQAQYHPHG